MTSLYSKRFV